MNLLQWKHVVAAAVVLGVTFPGLAAESISGQVVHALTGNPLRRVTLTATRVDGKGEPATTQVDDFGRFVFQNLAAGGYLLSGERNGFDRQIHGSRLNPNTGTVLAVKDGQPVTGVVFRLFPNAVLSGRVLDADGEPMPNVAVRAYRREYRNGKLGWYPAGAAQTNDRGEYRLGGLRAGRYLVNATDFNFTVAIATSKGPLPDTPDRVNASTYYPGTIEFQSAEPVAVMRGEDRRGVDIQLVKGVAVRIRGRIAVAAVSTIMVVHLLPKSAAPSPVTAGSAAVVQPGERAFEIRGVIPGAYILVARSMDGFSAVSTPVPVEVGGNHIEGVELPLNEGGEVAGRILFDGSAKGASVTLEIPEATWMGPVSGTANEAGEFKLRGVFPIQYRLRAANLPEKTYLRAVKLGGQVVDPEGVEFSPASGAKLEILLGKASAELKGVVLGADEKPVPGATVVLIPASGRDTLYRTATSDYDGTFLLKSVPAGRYKALAWEDLEPDAYRDAEVVKPVEDRAAQVALEENGRGEVTLKVIPITKE
ncbi:MAG: carboxypeptidase-like regulatory domain-containing protein [Acidobacteriales bacterium]|nr:carboxypeptidase-like regulatory domain-containing protein [Terriglobales bacterium]